MKKRKLTAASKLVNMITGELEGVASKLLAAGKYREAQEIYKILLKREDNAGNRNGLAQCYLHRALAASEQRQLNKAIALWERHRQFCIKPQHIERYLGWLIKCHQHGKVKDLLTSLSIQKFPEEHPQLAVNLGFFHISGMLDLQQILPVNTALVKQGNIALAALTAYTENDRMKLEQQLKQIPFRSVYRDFCLLCKAAITLHDSTAKAQRLLNQIPAQSPYHHAVKLLRTMGQTGQKLLAPVLSLEYQQQLLVCEVQNWSEKQIQFLQDLNDHSGNITAKTKFDLAIDHQELLGRNFVQRFCYALLPEFPAGIDTYEKNFTALTTFAKTRIAAQHAELSDEAFEAIKYWRQCLELLHTDQNKNNLKIAQILCHIADINVAYDGNIEAAIESLQYDPEDRETYTKIINCYTQDNEQKEVDKWLQQAIQKFPEDVAFLTQAMLSSKNQKAVKKAGQFAQQLLKIDPLNSQAKDTLFHNHLAHTRHLFKAKQFQLAAKEIEEAEKLKLGKHYPALAKLLSGFLIYAKGDSKAGIRSISKNLHMIGKGDFIARYRLINEGLLLALPLPPLLQLFPAIAQDYIISGEEMIAFIKLLELQQAEDNQSIHKTLNELATELKKSIKEEYYSSAILFQFCRCLDRAKHFELLRYCSKTAQQRWPEPRWTFYKIYAEANGDPKKLHYLQLSNLQVQFAAAKAQGDSLAATLISRFLDKHHAAKQAHPDEV